MMANAAKISHISLTNARTCLESKCYGRSFANFLLFLKLQPERCKEVYLEFSLATRQWCEQLEEKNRIEDLFKCYDQACELYPDHDTVLNNIGAQLFRLGYIEEAAAYIRRSLLVNPHYLAARDNLENISSHLVERWHFSMLNDKRRNIAYKFAIEKAVKSGYNTVLDIGTGTGILSMMSEQSGASTITACDRSRAMVEVARDVMVANGVQNKISLLHMSSTDMHVPENIQDKVRLVVTETFDAGLFGEHIVSTMTHAWKNLISTAPMGTVIPCGATMYACGIECETIRGQNRMMYPMLQYVDLSNVEILCSTGHVAEEPYTTENLSRIRGGYKILTNITELLRVNFTNLCELESLNAGKDWLCDLYVKQNGRLDALAVWFDLHLDDTVTIATGADNQSCWEQALYPITNISRQNTCEHENCVLKKKDRLRTVFHFEQDCLRLAKCEIRCNNQGTMKSTKTDIQLGHCGISVKQCNESCLPFRKRKVDALMSVDNPPMFGKGMDCLEITDKIEKEDNCLTSSTLSVTKSEHENISELTENVITDSQINVHVCSRSETSLQNETEQHIVNEMVVSDAKPSCQICAEPEMAFSMEKCSIDMSHDQMFEAQTKQPTENVTSGCAKSTFSSNVDNIQSKLTCLAEQADIVYLNDIHLNKQYCQVLENFRKQRTAQHLSFLYITPRLSFLAIQACKIGYHKVTMATAGEHHSIIHQMATLNGCRTKDITLIDLCDISDTDLTADIIICDIVESCGALRQQALEDLTLQRATTLSDGGLILPGEVRVHGLFIESEELENLSHVIGNDKTLDFEIAEFINVFQMQNHVNIDLTTLPHNRLSEVFQLLHIDLHKVTAKASTNILQQTVIRSVDIINSGKISALVYWFEMTLSDNIIVNTLDSRCHFKQAGIMIKNDVSVSTGQRLVTKVILQNSCLDVKIAPSETVNGVSH